MKQRHAFQDKVQKILKTSPSAKNVAVAEHVMAYVKAFTRRSDADHLHHLDPANTVVEARHILDFVKTRAPRDILVKVSNLGSDSHAPERTILTTCMTDQPFLLDTLRLALSQLGIREYRCHHPIIAVVRNEKGDITALGEATGDKAVKESWMHFELELLTDDAQLKALESEVLRRLSLSRGVVGDHKRMLRRVTAAANDILLVAGEQDALASEIDEISQFLQWLMQEHFIFLGFQEFSLKNQDDAIELTPTAVRLGIHRDELRYKETEAILPTAAKQWLQNGSLLKITKGDQDSIVHRSGKLDTVLIRQLDENGEPTAVQLISGLFTRKALNTQGQDVPRLNAVLQRILAMEDDVEESHNYKALVSAFDSLPVEFLFNADQDTVRQALRMIISSETRKEATAFLRIDSNGRSAFLLLSVPRDRYDEGVRTAISERLTNLLRATYQDERSDFGEYDNVVAAYFITSETDLTNIDTVAAEEELLALTERWENKFERLLREHVSESEFQHALRRFGSVLPKNYQLVTSPEEGVEDVKALTRLETTDQLQFRISTDGESDGTYKLKIFQDHNIFLTDSLPILANFGLDVIDQSSTTLKVEGGAILYIDTFRIKVNGGQSDLLAKGNDLSDALRAVLTGGMEDDRLNRLLLKANLTYREVDVLRAYISCARQIDPHLGLEQSRTVWTQHPKAVTILIDFLNTKFDPGLKLPKAVTRESRVLACKDAFTLYLHNVQSASEDRILRAVYGLVDATIRINFFRLPTRPYISFKLASEQIEHMPSPKPYREIFVHHAQVEGVHLRGGPIARGGLRWSDRAEDFRTEVLGLMKTQMVKNTVIVPVGSKGGFILKKPDANRSKRRQQADEMYKIFINGLLDITDNLVDAKVKAPSNVVRYDEDDPYLVVAADKGTAHLSDTANGISLERGFWLGDAFASGGSQGYDHKKEGITAKGAWVCTRRIFQEMGVDPEKDVITVAGIGDMGGDVFGNGLLLSKSVKLQAAFNHMHIFFDPDPDPAASWEERQRLFKLAGAANWADYSKEMLSNGGGIFDRSAKAIQLTPETKAMLGVDKDILNGDEAIRAILCMQVDLLWNGGIGTYVRASHESDRDANDRANDAVRVTALELGAKVVGEGGNLGLTQAARVEFARNGGRLNTDFVDNSAGVDMSDHEVNLKLLLASVVRDGQMTETERNDFLRKLTDEVSEAVLQDNFSQSRAISLDEIRSSQNLTPFASLIEELDHSGVAKRDFEKLPSKADLAERRKSGEGLSRPELAILLAFTKMRIYKWLLKENRFGGEVINKRLVSYFPKEVQERLGPAIQKHPLRNEIIATVLTSQLVDYAGSTFFQEIWEDTSFRVPKIAMAYIITAEMLGARRLEKQLHKLEGEINSEILYRVQIAIEDALNNLTRRMLRRGFDIFNPDAVVNRYTADFRDLHLTLADVLPKSTLAQVVEKQKEYIDAGLPEALAQEAASFPHLASGGDIAILTEESGLDLPTSAWLYHKVGEEVAIVDILAWSYETNGQITRWEKTALHVMRGKLIDAQYNIALNIANSRQDGQKLAEATSNYFTARKAMVGRINAIRKQIEASKGQGLAAMTVLAEAIEDLVLAS